MVNINFVPDDYTQSNESRRTNLIYLVLFAVVMIALGGSFVSKITALTSLSAAIRICSLLILYQ